MVEYESLTVSGKDILDKWVLFDKWLEFRQNIKFSGGYGYNPSTNVLNISISKKHHSYKLIKSFIRKINKENKQQELNNHPVNL